MLNLMDFGAAGDGITDDSAAIQAAIDALPLKGGRIYCPSPDEVYIGANIVPKSGVTFEGDGGKVSVFKLKPGANYPLFVRANAATDIHFRSVGLDGNKANNIVGHPIEFAGVTDSSITHCHIFGSSQNGIRWDGCTGNLIAFNQVYENTFCGIRAGETGTSVHTRITGNYTLNNDVIGISVDKVSRFIITSNNTNNNGDNGIDLCASNQCVVADNVSLSNTNQGIAIDGWTYPGLHCDDDIITGNVCMYNGQYGFDTANGNNRLIVSNNNLLNNGLGALNDTGTGSGKKIKENKGFVTENSGVVQVPAAANFVDVTHGLSFIPNFQDIQLTRSSNGGASGNFWMTNLGAFTFRINTAANPGAGGAWFVWAVSRFY